MKSTSKKVSVMTLSSWSQPLNKSYLYLIFYTLHAYIHKFSDNISAVHNNNLNKLQIQQPNFRFIDNVIFNFSSFNLSKKEKFILSFGLSFCLPCFKPNFSQFFLPFEQLAQCIKPLRDSSSFYMFRKLCSAGESVGSY